MPAGLAGIPLISLQNHQPGALLSVTACLLLASFTDRSFALRVLPPHPAHMNPASRQIIVALTMLRVEFKSWRSAQRRRTEKEDVSDERQTDS